MKGPEAAALYPDPALRPYCDLDFLGDDPEAARAALMASGFVETDDAARYEGTHHLRPLVWPAVPLLIELHREPNRPPWLAQLLDTRELLELTRPSATGVPGLLGPIPAAHAVPLAAHAWAHGPLRRLLDLVDVTVVLEDEHDRGLAHDLAGRWGLGRMWRTTSVAADALFEGPDLVPTLRIWARHLLDIRERTVFETHLARWAGPLWGLPYPRLRTLGPATRIFAEAARPRGDERWLDALRRTGRAVADAPCPQSQHDLVKTTRKEP